MRVGVRAAGLPEAVHQASYRLKSAESSLRVRWAGSAERLDNGGPAGRTQQYERSPPGGQGARGARAGGGGGGGYIVASLDLRGV